PDVTGRDLDVDLVVLVADDADPGVVEIALRAQDARRLLDPTAREGLTGLEEQVVAYRARARLEVQFVGEPEDAVVVLRVAEIEDVLVVDLDRSDHGAVLDELGVGGDALGVPREAVARANLAGVTAGSIVPRRYGGDRRGGQRGIRRRQV